MKGEKTINAVQILIAEDPQKDYTMTIQTEKETLQVHVPSEVWRHLGDTAGWFSRQQEE